jgi:cell division septum initiation protein DivIVA
MADRPGDAEAGAELDELLSSLGASRPMSEISVASAKVAAIVEAAERAAEDLRLKTETRVRERIAEADRAANLRVEAAEAEARDIVEAARLDASELVEQARRDVQAVHDEAARTRSDAEAESARVRAEVEAYAKDAKQAARDDARAIVNEAQAAARGVLSDGTELSGHLQELSDSLHRNAERLLNDVKLAHARLTADLDQAAPAGGVDSAPRASRGTGAGTGGAAGAGSGGTSPGFTSRPEPQPTSPPSHSSRPDDDFEIPEFLPGRR